MSENSHTETLIELNVKLERLLTGIEMLGQNQERMAEDISKIEEDVANIRDPDEGLYARLRALEQWKTSTSKIQWIVLSTVLALAVKQAWDAIAIVQ